MSHEEEHGCCKGKTHGHSGDECCKDKNEKTCDKHENKKNCEIKQRCCHRRRQGMHLRIKNL